VTCDVTVISHFLFDACDVIYNVVCILHNSSNCADSIWRHLVKFFHLGDQAPEIRASLSKALGK
jgi:hypothetical protein